MGFKLVYLAKPCPTHPSLTSPHLSQCQFFRRPSSHSDPPLSSTRTHTLLLVLSTPLIRTRPPLLCPIYTFPISTSPSFQHNFSRISPDTIVCPLTPRSYSGQAPCGIIHLSQCCRSQLCAIVILLFVWIITVTSQFMVTISLCSLLWTKRQQMKPRLRFHVPSICTLLFNEFRGYFYRHSLIKSCPWYSHTTVSLKRRKVPKEGVLLSKYIGIFYHLYVKRVLILLSFVLTRNEF